MVSCDVDGSTSTAVGASATEIVARRTSCEVMVPIVGRDRGRMDQFIGDGRLAVSARPRWIPNHADRGVECAVESACTLKEPQTRWPTIGVGVNSGTGRRGVDRWRGPALFSVTATRSTSASRGRGGPARPATPCRPPADPVPGFETIEVQPAAVEIRVRPRMELDAPVIPEVVSPRRRWGRGRGAGRRAVIRPAALVAGDGLGRRSRTVPGVGRGDECERGLGLSSTLPGGQLFDRSAEGSQRPRELDRTSTVRSRSPHGPGRDRQAGEGERGGRGRPRGEGRRRSRPARLGGAPAAGGAEGGGEAGEVGARVGDSRRGRLPASRPPVAAEGGAARAGGRSTGCPGPPGDRARARPPDDPRPRPEVLGRRWATRAGGAIERGRLDREQRASLDRG